MTESYSTTVKAALCEKTAHAFGFLPSHEDCAGDCCKIAFFCALILFGAKKEGDTLQFRSKNPALCDLFASSAAAFYSLSPQVENDRVTLKIDTALERILRAAGLADDAGDPLPLLLCPNCRGYVLRAAFLLCGTLSDPQKSAQLNLTPVFHHELLVQLCRENEIDVKVSVRRGKPYLYLRSAARIEDFLTLIGAEGFAMQIMNTEIERSMRALVNRQNNFDTANLSRSMDLLLKLDEAILNLTERAKIDSIGENLLAIVRLRRTFPEDTLGELGARLAPKLSKSGLYHRVKKIIDLSEK